MVADNQSNKFLFLANGGEMGALMRAKDWQTTSMGPVENWPLSLLTTLGILLNSKFPMFLYWGPDHICFYNDAYRPSLGKDGKHPDALGKKGQEVWAEIWPDIQPLIGQVMGGGEASWSADQLLPIYRNGRLEEVYWTFSYSAVLDDTAKPYGVFVTCMETTEKVLDRHKLVESEVRFWTMAEDSDILIAMSDESSKATYFSEAWVNLTGRSTQALLARGWSEMIHPDDRQRLLDHYQQAFEKRLPWTMEFRILNKEGAYSWLLAKGTPRFHSNGHFAGYVSTNIDMTERKTAEQNLEKSERDMRLMVLQAPFAMSILRGPDYVVEVVNPPALEVWGRSKEDVLQKPILEVMPELLDQGIKELLDKVYQTGQRVAFTEMPVQLRRNGQLETSYNNFSYEPLFNTAGAVNGIMPLGIDVTELVLARHKLEESVQLLNAMIESAPFPISVYVGREMRIHSANQSIIQAWGKGEDVIGRLFTDILPELQNQAIFQQLDEVFATGRPYHARNTQVDLVVNDQLQSFYFNYSFTPIFDASGQVYGIMNTAADVTDMNMAKRKIEENEERLNLVIEASELGTWEWHLKTGEIIYSEKYLDILGLAKDRSYSHQEMLDRFHPEDILHRKTLIEEAMQTGYLSYETRILGLPDLRWIEVKGKLYYDQHQKPEKLLGTVRNINKQKIFAAELEKQVRERTKELAANNEQLEKMNKELESFAYISSHDLQEPLRKIQIFATRIIEKEYATLSEAAVDYFSRMQKAAQRMQTLIDDLLAYSRASSTDHNFEATELREVLEEIKEDLKEDLKMKNAVLESNEMCKAYIIPFQFRQLLYNLIGNALKFAKTDTPPHIKINSRIVSGNELANNDLDANAWYCHLSVTDNGIGFEKEYSEKIFEVFQRLHGKDEYEGTGIGLAIVKKIVENHAGIITANSNLNEGATFDIYFPYPQ